MKILVTGGAGFIGTNLIKNLMDDHKVYSLDNYSIGSKKNHLKGAEYIDGDVIRIEKILKNDFDICYHLAGLSRIQPSFSNPFQTFNANTLAVQKILDWSRKNNTKVIYSGSSSRHHDQYRSPYAFYKYLGEEICKMYKNIFKLNIQIARFYNVYGPHEIIDGDWAAVIGIWRKQVSLGKKITIVGDGNQKRDFTHVKDIVDGLKLIAFSKEDNDDAWELGTGINYSINEVFKMFRERFSVDSEHIEDQAGNYRETLRLNNEMISVLGWDPKDRLNDYIKSL
jgi:UDP-glucose 4-epimerase|tara:strand:- start:1769 stop:2614 length:846 start_codon:yes stop_codon:yes gene_type:complete